jgi:hypothetical protein
MGERIFTYRFQFAWADGTEDETEFCAASMDEAMELFVDWCHYDMQTYNIPDVHPFVVYNADDAAEYKEKYFANPCSGHIYKDLVCVRGKVYAEEFPISGEMDDESVYRIDDFLDAVAKKHHCQPDEVITYLEDVWHFTTDYNVSQLSFGPKECGFYIDGTLAIF